MVPLMSQGEQLFFACNSSPRGSQQANSYSNSVKYTKKKETVPSLHGEVIVEKKEGKNSDTCYNMDELCGHYAK